MLLAKEETIVNGYINIKVYTLSLKEDNIAINNTVKIQNISLEFDVNLGDTNLLIVDNPKTTVALNYG